MHRTHQVESGAVPVHVRLLIRRGDVAEAPSGLGVRTTERRRSVEPSGALELANRFRGSGHAPGYAREIDNP